MVVIKTPHRYEKYDYPLYPVIADPYQNTFSVGSEAELKVPGETTDYSDQHEAVIVGVNRWKLKNIPNSMLALATDTIDPEEAKRLVSPDGMKMVDEEKEYYLAFVANLDKIREMLK